MYVPTDYSDYKYVVSVSDNYIILTDVRSFNASWDNPRTIDIIYQFFNPSFVTLESTRSFSSSQTFSSIDVSDSFYSRADCNQIIVSQFLILFFVIFNINALTRLLRKGGIFFGS